MLRLLSGPGARVNPLDLLLGDDRTMSGRPWVMMNMISSIDGATSLLGTSTGLGDADDREMFAAMRTVPDVILVGSGTVTAEDYSPVSLDERRRARRVTLGKAEVPVLAIVSGRLSIGPGARVFSDSNHRPLVLTGPEANPSKLMMLGDAAEVVILGDLSPGAILGHLSAASVILLEGGPTLNGQFVAAGVVDELNLTISPKLVSGDASRMLVGPDVVPPADMRLDRVLAGDHALFLRYLRDTPGKEVDHG